MPKLPVSEVLKLLDNPDTPQEELTEFFVEIENPSGGMAPEFAFNPDKVDLSEVEAQGVVPESAVFGWLTGMLNRRSRRIRQRNFEKRIAQGYSGPRLVSEGDSWFQYPTGGANDLIDYIDNKYAVFCLSGAGDEFDNMMSPRNVDRIADAIRNAEADGFLFSGGGNDIAGPEFIQFLNADDQGSTASDFISARFDDKLSEMMAVYRTVFQRLWGQFPHLKIFFHGYDYAIPRDGGTWLGKPLARMGTINREYWTGIVREMQERYNVALAGLADEFSARLFHADCRGAVGGTEYWRDELHAKSSGCSAAAARFIELIDRELTVVSPESQFEKVEAFSESSDIADDAFNESEAAPPPEANEIYGDLLAETELLPDGEVALEDSIAAVPESFAEAAIWESSTVPQVGWPRHDANAPDYAHFIPLQRGVEFELTGAGLEKLIAGNYFKPHADNGRILFALRGARLANGHQQQGQAIALVDQRPDHANPRCVLGVYDRNANSIVAYTGSTVPNGQNMIRHWKRANGIDPRATRANLLPTGCYRFRRGSHGWDGGSQKWKVPVALRLTGPSNGADASATVIRSSNDVTYGTLDEYDLCVPTDNIHCAYGATSFSSAGCLTIRGTNQRYASRGTLQWGQFQSFILSMEIGAQVDCVLLTGAEAALVSRDREQDYRRLRAGSQGDAVRRLQAFLGLQVDGDFGPTTKHRLTKWQRNVSSNTSATGVYTPAEDSLTGQAILGAA